MKSLRALTVGVLRSLAAPVVTRLNASKSRILTYHRFPSDRSLLRSQCDHIRKHYQPISLSTMTQGLSGEQQLPSNSLTVTVDDGYRDFLLHGHPVFAEFGIPTTVFLVTDFLDGALWLWWNQLQYAIEHTPHRQVEFLGTSYPLGDASQKAVAVDGIAESLKRLPNLQRLAQQQNLWDRLAVQIPAQPPPGQEPLLWDEVRHLSRQGVEFGGHTRTHPILSQVEDDLQLHNEIAGCKQRIEHETSMAVRYFCFPNGRPEDVGPRVTAITKQSGYIGAVTTQVGMNESPAAGPFGLKRLSVEPDFDLRYYSELLAGLRRG